MESYRPSAGESLRALLSCCFTAAPPGAGDASGDGVYMSRHQQQQQQHGTNRLPWFLRDGGPANTDAPDVDVDENDSTAAASTASRTSSLDDVLAASATAIAPAHQPPPRWLLEDRVSECMQCRARFDLFTRKHHCRACGRVFCAPCTSQRERVVRFGFSDPVRVCLPCAIDARAQNDFYERHLPLLERGAVFVKHGLLRKRLVEFRFVRAKLLFQYQTLDADSRAPVAHEIKAFPLDSITDVKQVPVDKENGMLGLLLLVGAQKQEQHRLDAATPEQKQQWLAAIAAVRALRGTLVARERDRRAQQAEQQHAEMLKATESMRKLQEKKESFHQERMQKRAEQRELLRAKYKLGAASSASSSSSSLVSGRTNAPTAAS